MSSYPHKRIIVCMALTSLTRRVIQKGGNFNFLTKPDETSKDKEERKERRPATLASAHPSNHDKQPDPLAPFANKKATPQTSETA